MAISDAAGDEVPALGDAIEAMTSGEAVALPDVGSAGCVGTLSDAAIAGLGIAWLPTFHSQDGVRTGMLEVLNLGLAPDITPITIAYRHDPPARLRALIDYLKAAESRIRQLQAHNQMLEKQVRRLKDKLEASEEKRGVSSPSD